MVFVEPFFPKNQREFARALAEAGATVIGIGEYSADGFDDQLKGWLDHYEQVPSVTDVEAMTRAVRWVQDKLWVDRLEATVEAHIMSTAQVREACTIPGTSVHTAWLCRDKPSMKEALRAAGVPTAASAGVSSAGEAREFAAQVGYPLILKPRSGAGASGTVRVDSDASLDSALGVFGGQGVDSIAVEEFIEGHEGFYDTIAVDGRVAVDFASHYFPNVLEAMRTRWISPEFISTNRIDSAPEYAELREMGQRVITALGIGTSATHMEWFFGPKGLKFSEIGCRPPGVGAWDLYSAGNDMDLYRAWADGIVARRGVVGAVAAVRQRDRGAAAVAGRDDQRVQRGRRAAAAVRRVGHRRAPAVAGHADAGRGGRVHGQRLRPDAPPRLRRAARHARHGGAHAARLRVVRAILLGPQRRPTLDAVVRSLGLPGPFATVTAGWQEREPDDGELRALLGGRR